MDDKVFHQARENAEKAGVASSITFQKKPVEEFSSKKKYGCIICNPPYNIRIGTRQETEKLYKAMGQIFFQLDSWSIFVLSGNPDFEKLFGKKASKNRKLYNGNIKCYLYQYLTGSHEA
jgi:putative N6-adenine-specific DNA methylase